MRKLALVFAMAIGLVAGCGDGDTPEADSGGSGLAPPAPANTDTSAVALNETSTPAENPSSVPPVPPQVPPLPPAVPAEDVADGGDDAEEKPSPLSDDNVTVVKAEAGVGTKGHYESHDYISTVVSAKFRTAEKLEFIKIQKAMQLYKAEHDNKGPADHKTFMKDIIEANFISLPKLPAGQSYYYDPKTEALHVVRPKP